MEGGQLGFGAVCDAVILFICNWALTALSSRVLAYTPGVYSSQPGTRCGNDRDGNPSLCVRLRLCVYLLYFCVFVGMIARESHTRSQMNWAPASH